MQEENQNFSEYFERTRVLADRLGIPVVDLPPHVGISKAMLFAYRKGKYPISWKAWRKLEAAERAAGIGVEPEVAAPDPPPDNSVPGESGWVPLASIKQLQQEMRGLQQTLKQYVGPLHTAMEPVPLPFTMADLRQRMEAAGAWPPDADDLRLTPGELMSKYGDL